MKEKKLSGDELIMNLDKMIEDYKNEIGWCDVWEKTTTQLKSLIESPDKYTPAILDELHEVRMKNVELKEQIEAYKYPGSHKNKETEPSEERIRTRGAGWGRGRGGEDTTNKEPSEAKLDKYVEEKVRELEGMFLNHGISRATESMRKDFIHTIVEDCKPKVGSKAIGKMVKKYFNTTHPEIINHGIKEMLEEAGVEVEGC